MTLFFHRLRSTSSPSETARSWPPWETVNCATVTRFEDADKVLISRNISKGVPDPYCTWTPVLPKNIPNPLAPKIGPECYIETYQAELFVNALGNKADEAPYLEGVKMHVAPEVYNIGDSFSAAFVKDATRAGFNLANQI
jgi:2-enoate reductase